MKITTIWTAPAMTLGERLRRTGDWLGQKSAAALPARIRYWAFVQSSVRAIDAMPPATVVPDIHLMDALKLVPGGPR